MPGCETTTLHSIAYTWDTPKNCVMTKILTKDAKKLHYPILSQRIRREINSSSLVNSTTLEKDST